MSDHGWHERHHPPQLADRDYRRLADLRYGMRSFLHWSELEAKRAGITPGQYQLMLAIRASTEERGPTIGAVADWLLTRHHSAVELCDRAAEAGLIERNHDPDQPSFVRLRLTARGMEVLEELALSHAAELTRRAPEMREMWSAVERAGSPVAAR